MRDNIKFIFYFLASLWILDAGIMGCGIWLFPNETAWGAEPHYNFEYRLRKLKRERDDEEFLILVVGSSIAEYSVHEDHLKKHLEEKNFLSLLPESKKKIGVYLLAHQGQNSINLLSTADRILSLNPDLIVHPVNMIDFRLERPLVNQNMEDLDKKGNARKKALQSFARSVVATEEISMLGPYGQLRRLHQDLTPDEIVRSAMSVIFSSYRYRNAAAVPFSRFLDNRFGKHHSYHFYSGMDIQGGGVNQNGHVGTHLEISWNRILENDGFEIQIYPAMFLTDEIFMEYSVHCSPDKKRKIPLKSGWQKINFEDAEPGDRICISIHPGLYTDFFADTLAGRLADNTGTGPIPRTWIRQKRREDALYRNYTKQEYKDSFQKRLMRFDEAGMAYLHFILQSKQEMAKRKFDAEYPVFSAYENWKDIIRQEAPLLIVNSPENPITLSHYRNSLWYDGYLEFLSCSENSGCSMRDESRGYREQLFYDYHHMSWYGAEEFTENLSEMIVQNYPQLKASFIEDRN